MRTLVLGAAAGLAVSMPGALAFSSSPAVASLHRSPAALPLRSASRKPQSVVKASLRSEEEPRRARPAVSLPAMLAMRVFRTSLCVCVARRRSRCVSACAVCIVSVRAWR